ncbi:hypothetical protein ACEUDA_02345 [Aeromonas rivipollensis]
MSSWGERSWRWSSAAADGKRMRCTSILFILLLILVASLLFYYLA